MNQRLDCVSINGIKMEDGETDSVVEILQGNTVN